MFKRLQELLNHKGARLNCVAAGGHVPTPPKHVARIDHEVTPALDRQALGKLRRKVGDLPELLAFYGEFGSLRLFRDSVTCKVIGRASAYYVAPPEEWAGLKECVSDWLSDLDEEEAEEALPEWITKYVAVGEVPNSGNYFLVPLVGSDRGKVFEFEHDGMEFIERGASFAEFIHSLIDTTPEQLKKIGWHTRYLDGKTEYQWMPESYAFDVKSV